MVNKHKDLYETIHHPDNILMVAANQLHKDNIQAYYEKTNSSKYGSLGWEFFNSELNSQIKKSIDENATVYESIFESSMPCLIMVIQNKPSIKIIEIEDISVNFSNLEKESEILLFAKEYGLLGVLDFGWNNYYHSSSETLITWHTYIEHIKRLLKLYKALKDKRDGKNIEVIGEFFDFKDSKFMTIGKKTKNAGVSWTKKYSIREMDNQLLVGINDLDFPIPDLPRSVEESHEYDGLIGSYILALLIKKGLDGAVKISFSEVYRSDKSAIGFSFNQTYSSSYLLGAIYQDLWRLITTDTPIRYCHYCHKPFPGKGKKTYCNNSCKQMAYNVRKSKLKK